MSGFVNMVDPVTGDSRAIPLDQVADATREGWTAESTDQADSRLVKQVREEQTKTVGGAVAATGAGILRGATLGGSDLLFSALGGDDVAADLQALREDQALASFGGEVFGSFGGLGAGVSKIGSAIAKTAEGAGAATRAGRAALGSAAEGLLQGGGAVISDLALSKDPLTLENFMGTVGTSALLSGFAGGATSAGGALLRKAQSKLDDVARGESRLAAVDDVANYQAAVKEANPWLVMDEGTGAAHLNQTNRAIRKALDDPQALTKTPQAVLKPLRIQQKALEETIAQADDITTKLAKTSQKMAAEVTEQVGKLADDVDEVVLSGRTARRYASFADVKLSKGKTLSVTRDQAATFAKALNDGTILGSGAKSLDNLTGLLEQNKALQSKIEAGVAKASGGPQSLAQNMLGGQVFGMASSLVGAIPGLGAIPGVAQLAGSMASKFVTEGLDKVLSKQAARTSKAIGAFLDVTGKVPNVAPVLSSKVFGAVKYNDSKASAPKNLADGYKLRTDEIKSQTMYAADGKAVMRPEARERMAKSLDGVRAVDPIAADRMETHAARAIEFLSNRIPRRPDLGGIDTGPSKWQPSEMEMRKTARYMAAVEDPTGIVERLGNGSITPEDAEVMREVYPEMYADIQRRILAELPTLRATLPYQRRLALSIFSGLPVDPAMHPRILSVLQEAHEGEAGTEGGEMGPKPQPAFGSVKNREATPSESRQGVV